MEKDFYSKTWLIQLRSIIHLNKDLKLSFLKNNSKLTLKAKDIQKASKNQENMKTTNQKMKS